MGSDFHSLPFHLSRSSKPRPTLIPENFTHVEDPNPATARDPITAGRFRGTLQKRGGPRDARPRPRAARTT